MGRENYLSEERSRSNPTIPICIKDREYSSRERLSEVWVSGHTVVCTSQTVRQTVAYIACQLMSHT